jgi:hypothetical protein
LPGHRAGALKQSPLETDDNSEAFGPDSIDGLSNVYMVKSTIWQAAGMVDFGGCLCIACLEKRLGRKLRPRDFVRNHPFNT